MDGQRVTEALMRGNNSSDVEKLVGKVKVEGFCVVVQDRLGDSAAKSTCAGRHAAE